MQRSKTTEQGAVLTELNTEPGVIQFEYQSEIIETFTGKIKQTSAGWMVLVETPKKPLLEKFTQIIHFLTPGKPHMTLQQAITVLNEEIIQAEEKGKAHLEKQQSEKASMDLEMDELFEIEK